MDTGSASYTTFIRYGNAMKTFYIYCIDNGLIIFKNITCKLPTLTKIIQSTSAPSQIDLKRQYKI